MENKRLEMKRDNLRKAAACFAKEPKSDTNYPAANEGLPGRCVL
jgi:hypothetical protein